VSKDFDKAQKPIVVDKPDDEEKIENCDINTNARR
jgi:hypothetical protein